MTKLFVLSAVAVAATISALPLTMIAPAQAQSVDVYVTPSNPVYVTPTNPYAPPPRGGAFGDRDRDGIPNIADNYNNNRDNRGGRGDQDRDGVPNRYDRDRDGDGVPNRWDSNPSNPWRR